MMFFKNLFDYRISFSLLIKKQPFIFFPKKQRIYDYFSEFASEALHIVIFENLVKSMTSCLSKLKVTPSFCFPFKIPDDPTATNVNRRSFFPTWDTSEENQLSYIQKGYFF
jgi:hypothetical protein